jgi:hypothetical protein
MANAVDDPEKVIRSAPDALALRLLGPSTILATTAPV